MTTEEQDRIDAARWRWFRSQAHLGTGEDGELYLGTMVADEDWHVTETYLTKQQGQELNGLGSGFGMVNHPDTLDAVADAHREKK